MTTSREALEEAIVNGGGLIKFSGEMGVKHQAVTAWRKKGFVPIQRAYEIEHKFSVPALLLMDPRLANLVAR